MPTSYRGSLAALALSCLRPPVLFRQAIPEPDRPLSWHPALQRYLTFALAHLNHQEQDIDTLPDYAVKSTLLLISTLLYKGVLLAKVD
jgi:hypothetical protein